MRWLHLSDLHIGVDNAAQTTAIESLVDAVAKHAGNAPFDMILITGDLAFSGRKSEYHRLKEILVDPLRAMQQFEKARIVAVPGNHDLDCDVGVPISWDRLGGARQGEFFGTSEKSRRLRQSRADGFKEYEVFTEACKIDTCEPTKEPARVFRIPSEQGKNISIVCLNTSYFSDKATEDKGIAPAPTEALRDALRDQSDLGQVLVIGHHPPTWFMRESAHHFKSLLIEKAAVYLHGHIHEIEPVFSGTGLVSLGFGAANLSSLSAQPKPYYRNTFAVCELDDMLRITFISWDSEYGRWTPESRLPADLPCASGRIGHCEVRLPTSLASSSEKMGARRQLIAGFAIRPRMRPPIWLNCEPKSGWVNLLEQLGELRGVIRSTSIGPQDANGGAVQFVAEDSSGQNLVRALSAASATITFAHIEQTNTLLDTESVDSCIFATFGTMSPDAATLAARLKDKKPLTVLVGTDIAERASKLSVVEKVLASETFSTEQITLTPLVVKDGIALLVVDAAASAWFCVVDPHGLILGESSELVFNVRKAAPQLEEARYWNTVRQHHGDCLPATIFDRGAYLSRSAELFDTVRYAGLAAVGFRLPVDSLRKLYVPAAADVAINKASQQALKTAVDDFIEALGLESSQRDQLEMQLRNYYGLNRSAEADAASGLYRRYGAVLVIGDPGSGKSCFVRNEILTYCQPPSVDGEWYAKHTPVFLPLADAARIAANDEDILDICVRFASSQKFDLTRRQLDILVAKGEVAFFFDGVDEVGSLERRERLLRQIGDLTTTHRREGNRFVVTSRPAAVRAADVHSELVRIHLRGLTNDEIAILATRIMSIEAATGRMIAELRREEREVVEQLVRDCEEKPGIRRLARNPLLLTLLVLIYANSGALAARRHTIYSQAIRTLVSVRHRASKSRVLSEADLRAQLGLLAIAVYRGSVSEIPSRREVRELLRLSPSAVAPDTQRLEVDSFLQGVAETTGLIVIHPRSDSQEDDVVSFMHHSFLEYYAAIGFTKERDHLERATKVALSPRWREVVTLMFGLLGDQGDVSDFLEKMAKDQDPADRITASRLGMALDCALECDVPPQRAQKLISALLEKLLKTGPGVVVADARAAIVPRVQELLQNTGSIDVLKQLVAGIKDREEMVSAAYIDFISRMPQVVANDEDLKGAVSSAFSEKSPIVRIACITVLQTTPSLRTRGNLENIRRCLQRGSVLEKHAALQLLDSESAMVMEFADEVVECLASDTRLISDLAARCVIVGGVFLRDGIENRELLDTALRIYIQGSRPQKRLGKHIDLSNERLENLIYSSTTEEQKLGIRCLVAVQREPAALHSYLFGVLRSSTDHQVRSACLEAMSVDSRMTKIASLADTDFVCKSLADNHGDVRRSAARALRLFPTIDLVRDALLERYRVLSSGDWETERGEVIRSLAAHGLQDERIRTFLEQELVRAIGRREEGWGEKRAGLVSRLIHACDQVGAAFSVRATLLLYELSCDFKTPSGIRRAAIRAFGRTAAPTPENGERLLGLLTRQVRAECLAAYKAAVAFAEKCRSDVSAIRAVRDVLDRLKVALIQKWDIEVRGARRQIDVPGLRDIRAALLAIEEIVVGYDEFASRLRVSEFDKQTSFSLDQLG